jgi:hypothetical protein
MVANGQIKSLYGMGVATQDIADGQEGFVTVFGKVRDINATGSDVGETWGLGDILYAHPTQAGKLTRVKPTAPNNVLPVAALAKVHATAGEIFVRPTIEQIFSYASFSDTTDQHANAINTPYAIKFNTTDIASGHSIANNTHIIAAESGLYNYQFSLQTVSSSSSKKDVWIWARKNGVDVPNSASRLTLTGNDVWGVAAWNYVLSMNANSYFQLMWAVTDVGLHISAPAATAFCPATPSAILTVTQAAL